MATTRKPTRLKRSKLENLFRHANGVYYARLKVNGKSKERSLHTTDCNLAASLLPEALKELRVACEEHQASSLAQSIHAEAHRDDPDLKPATQHYYRQLAKSIIATLPRHIAAKRLKLHPSKRGARTSLRLLTWQLVSMRFWPAHRTV